MLHSIQSSIIYLQVKWVFYSFEDTHQKKGKQKT